MLLNKFYTRRIRRVLLFAWKIGKISVSQLSGGGRFYGKTGNLEKMGKRKQQDRLFRRRGSKHRDRLVSPPYGHELKAEFYASDRGAVDIDFFKEGAPEAALVFFGELFIGTDEV